MVSCALRTLPSLSHPGNQPPSSFQTHGLLCHSCSVISLPPPQPTTLILPSTPCAIHSRCWHGPLLSLCTAGSACPMRCRQSDRSKSLLYKYKQRLLHLLEWFASGLEHRTRAPFRGFESGTNFCIVARCPSSKKKRQQQSSFLNSFNSNRVFINLS